MGSDAHDPTRVLTARIPVRLIDTLDALAFGRGCTRSDLVRQAVEGFVRDATGVDTVVAPHQGRTLLDGMAGDAIAAARARAGISVPRRPPPATPRRLSEQERRDALDLVRQGKTCRCCAGLHPGGELACPRLASFEVDGDGLLRAGTYWPDGSWDASGVLSAAEVAGDDSSPDERGGDGSEQA